MPPSKHSRIGDPTRTHMEREEFVAAAAVSVDFGIGTRTTRLTENAQNGNPLCQEFSRVLDAGAGQLGGQGFSSGSLAVGGRNLLMLLSLAGMW